MRLPRITRKQPPPPPPPPSNEALAAYLGLTLGQALPEQCERQQTAAGGVWWTWRQLPLPRRCPECHRWHSGVLEGITRIRFDVCAKCAGLTWDD